MNLQQMRDYVREFLDLDSEDLSDNVFDAFAREASLRIARRSNHWPFMQLSSTLALDPDAESYDLAVVLPQFSEIVAVGNLAWIEHNEAVKRFETAASTPLAFSVWENRLFVWPTPQAADTLAVRGFKSATEWVSSGAGGVPPFPEEFHDLIVKWGLVRAYAQQDDPELSAFHKEEFYEGLNILFRAYSAIPASRPMVMGGRPKPYYGPTPPAWPYGEVIF